ncbi:hypothetical protein HYW21_07275 [Candidatus Woesearchaeota archaeon]|nr:hypothetical protein [Candidatus Woesearchaeota archaeon]
MIESKKFKQIDIEFSEFCKGVNNKNEYQQEIFYLYEQALKNIKGGHFEIAMFILCVIIESIASKKNYNEYKTFDEWLCDDKVRIDAFTKELKSCTSAKNIIPRWYEEYRDTYGSRKNFVKLIVTTYKNLNTAPSFMRLKVEKVNGVKTSTLRTEGYKDVNELYIEFEKSIKRLYDKYRSPFAHEGKFLNFNVRIMTKVGGFSDPESISLHDIAKMVLDVMKNNVISLS